MFLFGEPRFLVSIKPGESRQGRPAELRNQPYLQTLSRHLFEYVMNRITSLI
jgi:hypothetical protein